MSDHALEDVVQFSVEHIARSAEFSIQEKRFLIYTLFQIQDVGDCGFTHRRTVEDMVACKYTFLFDKAQMYDYEEKRDLYDQDKPWIRAENTNGGVYDYGDKYCVDSGSEAWAEMVKIGAITGEGSRPVKRVDNFTIINLVGEIFRDELLSGDEWFQRGVGTFVSCACDGIFGTPEQEVYDRFLDEFYNRYYGEPNDE